MMRSRDAEPVPADGETMGEVMFRGNIVMKGYLKNPDGDARRRSPAAGSTPATSACCHPDGYVQDQGPLEGHHHLRRREHLVDRGRGRPLPPPGGAGGGGGRAARREVGRDAVRLRRAASRARTRDRGRDHRASAATTWRTSRCRAPWSSATLPKTSTGKIQKFMLRQRVEVGVRDRRLGDWENAEPWSPESDAPRRRRRPPHPEPAGAVQRAVRRAARRAAAGLDAIAADAVGARRRPRRRRARRSAPATT